MSFSGDKNRNSPAVARGITHHFGKELNKAQSRGFTIYSDSAPEFEKYARNLGFYIGLQHLIVKKLMLDMSVSLVFLAI